MHPRYRALTLMPRRRVLPLRQSALSRLVSAAPVPWNEMGDSKQIKPEEKAILDRLARLLLDIWLEERTMKNHDHHSCEEGLGTTASSTTE